MEVVARQGFDATVAEIAEASGVSPRTIFRHYASHDQLILATVKDMCEACGRKPIEGLPSPTDDLDGWIEGVALTIHTRNAEIFGEAFWDIHAPSRNASGVLAEVDALRHESRTRGVQFLASLAWRKAGGTGEPPQDLVLGLRPQPLGVHHPGAHDRLRPVPGPDRGAHCGDREGAPPECCAGAMPRG